MDERHPAETGAPAADDAAGQAQGAVAAPPAPPAPPATATASAPPPGGKRRRWPLVLLVVALLAAAGAGAGALVMRYGEKARDEAAVSTAEGHYDNAVTALESVEGVFTDVEFVSSQPVGGQLSSAAASATAGLALAEEELLAAEKAISHTDDAEARGKYLESIEAARRGIAGLGEMLDAVRRTGELLDRIASATEATSDAEERMNDAIELANARKWDQAGKAAAAAEKGFASAVGTFNDAHAADASAGLDTAAAYVSKEREEASLLVRMVSVGKAGKVDEYNKLVGRSEDVRKQLLGMEQPEILSDPLWAQARIDAYGDEAFAHLDRADDLRAEALEAFLADR